MFTERPLCWSALVFEGYWITWLIFVSWKLVESWKITFCRLSWCKQLTAFHPSWRNSQCRELYLTLLTTIRWKGIQSFNSRVLCIKWWSGLYQVLKWFKSNLEHTTDSTMLLFLKLKLEVAWKTQFNSWTSSLWNHPDHFLMDFFSVLWLWRNSVPLFFPTLLQLSFADLCFSAGLIWTFWTVAAPGLFSFCSCVRRRLRPVASWPGLVQCSNNLLQKGGHGRASNLGVPRSSLLHHHARVSLKGLC